MTVPQQHLAGRSIPIPRGHVVAAPAPSMAWSISRHRAARQMLLGHGHEPPIDSGLLMAAADRGRNVDERMPVHWTGFDESDSRVPDLPTAGCKHASRRTRADDHVSNTSPCSLIRIRSPNELNVPARHRAATTLGWNLFPGPAFPGSTQKGGLCVGTET